MSYVLEALKKADAERERERGAVPDIHAQPALLNAGEPVGRRRPAWTWAALAMALGATVAVTWYLASPAPRIEAEPPAGASATRPVTAFVPPTAAPNAAPNVAAPAAAAVPAAPLAAVPSPAARPVAPARKAAPAPAAPKQAAPALARKAVAAAPAGSAPDAPAERIYARDQLPDNVQQQLPQVTISGSMYSEEPSSRMLIINGRVLREGDRVTPDLTLQQIRLKAAVFLYKTYRYEQRY